MNLGFYLQLKLFSPFSIAIFLDVKNIIPKHSRALHLCDISFQNIDDHGFQQLPEIYCFKQFFIIY